MPRIVEVGPRDGLQNESTAIPTALKLDFIAKLAGCGIQHIEATSFVSPKWVPQLGDAEDLWPQLPAGPSYSALVPNKKGLERAVALGVDRIALFTAASDEFARRNINMDVQGSLQVFADVVDEFRYSKPSGWVRAYVSTAFECPYSGRVAPSAVVRVAEQLLALGVDEISLADTLGVASPNEVQSLTEAVLGVVPLDKLAYHFHDTRGTALANVCEALDLGISVFDSSAGGLGGCPYAPGAGGNLATEDLVYLLSREGFDLRIDLGALAQATLPILSFLGHKPASKAQLAALSACQA